MVATAVDVREFGSDKGDGWAADQRRFLWLGFGALALLFSGGGWDIALAPWIASVFLLRFSRTSTVAAGTTIVWLVSVGAVLGWSVQFYAPMTTITVLGSVVFGTVFTLPYLLDRLFLARLSAVGQLLLFPAVYAALEFLICTYSPSGTSFSLRAVTQYANLPLLQVISITGPYAIGFLIGWFATVANHVWQSGSWRGERVAAVTFGVVLSAILIGGSVRLTFFPPVASYVRTAAITPSVSALDAARKAFGGPLPGNRQELANADPMKLEAAYNLVTQDLLANTRQAANAGAKIVVWSETAANVVGPDKAALLEQASALAKQENIYLDIGVGIPATLNETHLFGPDGREIWQYNKTHPVPGMEFVPPGHSPVPSTLTPFGRLANVICFDGDFPSLMRQKADIMLIPAFDWGKEGQIHTLRMTSLRAIENGYSMLRSNRDGLSAAFDYQGRVLARQDTTTADQHIMLADVPTHGVTTVYNLIGDTFAWLCLAGTLALIAVGLSHRRAPSR
jgi:apolipoprotein N-acyltransferase